MSTIGFWDVDDATYYGDTDHLSASMLEDFRESAPLFGGRYITHTLPTREETAAMRLGTLFHRHLLEPDRYAKTVKVCDLGSRTKGFAAEQADARSRGLDLVNTEDYDLIAEMVRSILSHTVARKLLEQPGKNECAIRWEDSITGLPCKAKIDRLLDSGIILDPKTLGEAIRTSNPQSIKFAKSVLNYSYHIRAAHYLTGLEALGDAGVITRPPGGFRYLFIAVSKEAPFEVGVYELDGEALDLGDMRRRDLMGELHQRAAAQDWSSRTATKIETLSLPRWAYSN
jgi:exodeoxyribonuclease VIII